MRIDWSYAKGYPVHVPMITMQSVKNADLRCVADEVRAKLIKVMMRVEGTFEE